MTVHSGVTSVDLQIIGADDNNRKSTLTYSPCTKRLKSTELEEEPQ